MVMSSVPVHDQRWADLQMSSSQRCLQSQTTLRGALLCILLCFDNQSTRVHPCADRGLEGFRLCRLQSQLDEVTRQVSVTAASTTVDGHTSPQEEQNGAGARELQSSSVPWDTSGAAAQQNARCNVLRDSTISGSPHAATSRSGSYTNMAAVLVPSFAVNEAPRRKSWHQKPLMPSTLRSLSQRFSNIGKVSSISFIYIDGTRVQSSCIELLVPTTASFSSCRSFK